MINKIWRKQVKLRQKNTEVDKLYNECMHERMHEKIGSWNERNNFMKNEQMELTSEWINDHMNARKDSKRLNELTDKNEWCEMKWD